MYKLRGLIKRILNPNAELIVCPCGYKTASETKALRHLERHPGGTGDIDLTTGAISWS